jgi:hypothetical protein
MKSLRIIALIMIGLQVGSLFSAIPVTSSVASGGAARPVVGMPVSISNDIPEGKRKMLALSLNELQNYFNKPQAQRTAHNIGRANSAAKELANVVNDDLERTMPNKELSQNQSGNVNPRNISQDQPQANNQQEQGQNQPQINQQGGNQQGQEQETAEQKYTFEDLQGAVGLIGGNDYAFSPNNSKEDLIAMAIEFYRYVARFYTNQEKQLSAEQKTSLINAFSSQIEKQMKIFGGEHGKKNVLQELKAWLNDLITTGVEKEFNF